MRRVLHQYMGTTKGHPSFLETRVSPVAGLRCDPAAFTRAVNICEFTVDPLRHEKFHLGPGRNDYPGATCHGSCNAGRGMVMPEELGSILKQMCNHFYEMPKEAIRDRTLDLRGEEAPGDSGLNGPGAL